MSDHRPPDEELQSTDASDSKPDSDATDDEKTETEREPETTPADEGTAAAPDGDAPPSVSSPEDDEPAEPPDATDTETVDANAEETTAVDVARRMSRMTRRSLVTGVVASGAAYGGWRWLISRAPRPSDRLQWPLRKVLESNERIAKAAFSRRRRVKEWPRSRRDPKPRVNGRYGLDANADHTSWRLRIEGLASGGSAELTLDEVRKLPKTEMVTELRCIEGWSDLIHWGGVRLIDLMAAFPPATRDGTAPDLDERPHRLVRYVALETPDRGYWVGLDMASALHPQTLLAYEINDEPLSWEHGAPLRLVIPVKYGVKHIKRIGLIRYSDERPADYWAERKYDWYAGL
jgi:DMSO/TMAO reductase YedYZ molybdopterin-dependent catalytic subunit